MHTISLRFRYFTKGDEIKMQPKKEKHELVRPLAKVFVKKDIVMIREGANLSNLSIEDVNKEGTL